MDGDTNVSVTSNTIHRVRILTRHNNNTRRATMFKPSYDDATTKRLQELEKLIRQTNKELQELGHTFPVHMRSARTGVK